MNKVGAACNDKDCVNRIWVERGAGGGIWATHNKVVLDDGEPIEMRFCEPDPTEIANLIKDLKGLYIDLLGDRDE